MPVWRNEYILIVFKLLIISPNTPLECLFTAALKYYLGNKTSTL